MSAPGEESPYLFGDTENLIKGGGEVVYYTEITLRDLFAAFALMGYLANPQLTGPGSTYAREAYGCADAMLAAREVSR
jgi:hypothetical protein